VALTKLRIFAASPSELQQERESVADAKDDLRELADFAGIALDVVDWHSVMPGAGRPEQVILDQIAPSTWDVFVGILWHRFGTPPQKKGARRVYESGTEEEFQLAWKLWKKHGRPRVMFYRCTRDLPFDADPKQLARVQKFFAHFKADGAHPGLYRDFDTPGAFDRLIHADLTGLLVEYARQTSPVTLSAEKAKQIKEGGIDSQPGAPALAPRAPETKPAQTAPEADQASFTASEIAALYNFPAACDGTGECIGIVALAGGLRKKDINVYFDSLGLKTPDIKVVRIDGATNKPGDRGLDAMVTFDIELCGSMAPGARLAVYFAPNTTAGFVNAISTAARDNENRPSVLCISWGGPERVFTRTAARALNRALEAAADNGVTICSAAFDYSRTGATRAASFPGSSPHVLAVAGSKLESAPGKSLSEASWQSTQAGGAVMSSLFPLPDWQAASAAAAHPVREVPDSPSVPGRLVPDVSAHASPDRGYRVYISGAWTITGGSFAAADLWGALIARINQALGKRVGNLAPVLYNLLGPAGTLRRIRAGSDLGPGWDAGTGWGSPDGERLLYALRLLDLASTSHNPQIRGR
jgi:kumamolisin